MCGHRAQNLTESQVSPALSFTSYRDVRAGMDLYRQYAGFSPASKGSAILSQSKHWSGGRWVCRTCSAAPAIGCYLAALEEFEESSTTQIRKNAKKTPAKMLPSTLSIALYVHYTHFCFVNDYNKHI